MSSLYIVIPAYNESENIEKTIDQWYPVVERHNDEGNSRLVIINDGSKDNTYELLQNVPLQDPFLSHWINQTAVTVLQYFMDIATPSGRKPIIFSRLIPTVRPIQTNSSHFGTRGAGMMQ